MNDDGVMLVFTCCNCGSPATADPELVLSIPASWDQARGQYVPNAFGSRQPVCRRCAELALERIRSNDPTLTSVSPTLRQPGWLERAYGRR